jgi:hypothetical protein
MIFHTGEERTFMEDIIARFFENLADRMGGPMKLRFVLQPLMAVIFAVLDGIKDARAGRVPYFWALLTDPEHRRDRLRNGWKRVSKVFIMAVILDAVYQYITLKWFYPMETLFLACFLAIIPYLLVRGPFTRLMARWKREDKHE